MGKMKQLHAEGVRDLQSYMVGITEGRKQKSDEIVAMIQKALNNPSLDLEVMPTRMAIAVLIGAIQWSAEDEEEDN